MLGILFLLGLRISELESHTWSSFRKVQGSWWFFVVGKGDKAGKIPVNNDLLASMKRFRTHLGMHEYPDLDDFRPLIPSWHSAKALSSRQMSSLLKRLSSGAAMKFGNQPEKQEKLRKFSPHWLRHLSASMQDRVGVQFKHIRANHRHESDETTRRYVHAMDDERHDEMNKLRFTLE